MADIEALKKEKELLESKAASLNEEAKVFKAIRNKCTKRIAEIDAELLAAAPANPIPGKKIG